LDREGQAGRANIYLSWVWSYKVRMFVDALRAWEEEESEVDQHSTFVWVCFFCNNQNRLLSGADVDTSDLEKVFEHRLLQTGHVVALIDACYDPLYLTRIWTIFEQYTAARLKMSVTMVMPPAERTIFNERLASGQLDDVIQHLTDIQVQHAKASVPKDEDMVKALIKSTVGFESVNAAVRYGMLQWCEAASSRYMRTRMGVDVKDHHDQDGQSDQGTMERVRTASREAMGVIVELLSHPAHASGVTSEDSDAPKVPEHADAQQKNENSAPPAATRAAPTELMLEADVEAQRGVLAQMNASPTDEAEGTGVPGMGTETGVLDV